MLRINERALQRARQKAGLPVLAVLDRKSAGHMAMKPGRLRFSEPRPYSTHEPTLGRACTLSPQFMSMSDGSWFGACAYIERITAMSSACCAVFPKSSLISRPDCHAFQT
jgi:hypothetical protein